ncbi:hypothetical protein [Psychrobacter sp. ANT_WB68]|uniref:hypothetical protein n=1 Tax=Psychrobacter sp. ANT_WB68 TaxID=2597355 RepID=UPI0011F1DD68|nr:hypothetical protein [Psychrobacter sp. ANT_WB68]KAA0915264.1 hypothetical protein FQ084_01505 [Psychrobacter sp. ANT_WB68]
MSDNKRPLETNSSAEHVEKHLQELEKADYELFYYSQEQSFSADELARLINEERLNELLAQSDDFLASLGSELKDFDE